MGLVYSTKYCAVTQAAVDYQHAAHCTMHTARYALHTAHCTQPKTIVTLSVHRWPLSVHSAVEHMNTAHAGALQKKVQM